MSARYIPALSFRWLTPLYDPLLKWVMREETFKRKLIQQANIQPKMKVLDLGCGTGTLTLMLKRAHPTAEVTGMDGDPQVLDIARENPAVRIFNGMKDSLLPSRILIQFSTEWSPALSFTISSPMISAARSKRFTAYSNLLVNYTFLISAHHIHPSRAS